MTSLAFNCDCMEAMREFPDKFFDLAVVDPPYGNGCSQTVNVEREREGHGITVSENGLTDTSTPKPNYVNRGARPQQIPHGDGTDRGRIADSRTGRGVTRTGGGWYKKLDPTKKLLRGTSRRSRNISRSCFASHEIR